MVIDPFAGSSAHLRVHEFLRRRQARETVVLHTHPTELIVLTHLPEFREEAALNRANRPQGLSPGIVFKRFVGTEHVSHSEFSEQSH